MALKLLKEQGWLLGIALGVPVVAGIIAVLLSHTIKEYRSKQLIEATLNQTLPEFECKALKTSDIGRKLLGNMEFPDISLRRFASGRWLFRINGLEHVLDGDRIIKTTDYSQNKVTYQVRNGDHALDFSLIGQPPSRSGILTDNLSAPAVDQQIAQLTCH